MNMRAKREAAASGRSKSVASTARRAKQTPRPPPKIASKITPKISTATTSAEPQWLVHVRTSYAIQNVVGTRSDLPFWLVRWDGKRELEWMELGDPEERPKPFHFEIYFGKESLRDEHYLEAIDEA